MKETPLTKKHIALGARMTEFAGFNMPVYYASINAEHIAVRNNAGVFDVSHMGEFIIKGKEALELVQKVTSNDASKLSTGKIQYSCLPNETGGIVDDLLVYKLPAEDCCPEEPVFMLVVNASNIEKDYNWITGHNNFDAEVIDISGKIGLLAIQGPKSIEILQQLTDVNLKEVKFYTFVKGTFAGLDDIIISATGYTGAGGFEIYAQQNQLLDLWDRIFEVGKEYDLTPVGLGARDTLRLEMGYCLYGNDINDTTSPIEAGLGWITKVKKGDFISREFFAMQKKEGVEKKLVAFEVDARRVPRHGYAIENEAGEEIGYVTSGTQSPSLGIPIGLGYVKSEFSKPDTEIFIKAGKKNLKAMITKLPFYKSG